MIRLKKEFVNASRELDWIVDPDKQIVSVYGFEKDTVAQHSFGKDVPVGIYEGFRIKILQL